MVQSTAQFHAMTISATSPPYHFIIFYTKIMIATPSLPPLLSPPHPLQRFTCLVGQICVFLEIWHHFHRDDFFHGVYDEF
jgi:hypothetical protein